MKSVKGGVSVFWQTASVLEFKTYFAISALIIEQNEGEGDAPPLLSSESLYIFTIY